MTTREIVVVGSLLLLVVVVGTLEAMRPPEVDWSPSFSRYHDRPYGSKLVYERLPDLFGKQVRTTDQGERDAIRGMEFGGTEGPQTHLYVKQQVSLPLHDRNALLERVADGDQLFIAAWWLDDDLNERFGVAQQRMTDRDGMTVRFLGLDSIRRGFDFDLMPAPGYFSQWPEEAQVLAVNGRSEPVFLHLAWGEGDIWLCAEPRVLTNYNLLAADNAECMATMLSFLPPGPVHWNEFRKVDPQGQLTPLRWTLMQPALKWAYFLCIALVLLFMLTHARRQQRAIPVLAPVRNDSRDFVHTVARLYHQKGDHLDLARKMIAYFKDEVRQRAHIHRLDQDPDAVERLAKRTGLSPADIRDKLARIERYERQQQMSALQLTELEQLLHDLRGRL